MEHEIRVPITPATAQLLDALSAAWNCSYREVLARCVDQAAREQAKRTRLLAVIVRDQDTARAAANFQPRPGACDGQPWPSASGEN